MDKSATFVDAGYLLAAGGLLTCGTRNRKDFTCSYHEVVAALATFTSTHSGGMAPLRTYWYDGAPNAVATADQLKIGALSYVKIRLGRLIQGEQKGVDALIYRDLMTLARERAIGRAYLVSGDEDLREGVVAAQDMGVQVILVGIPTSQRSNQSAALIREVDEHVVLAKDFWEPYFAAVGDGPVEMQPPTPATGGTANAVGSAFAQAWIQQAKPEELKDLASQRPRIPRDLDIRLLVEAEATLGSLRERQDLKYELREGFWGTVDAAAHASDVERTSG